MQNEKGRFPAIFRADESAQTPETSTDELLGAIKSDDRHYDRRRIFARGERGQINASSLARLHELVSGAAVYARRSRWKHTPIH